MGIDGETVETVSDFIFWAPKSLQTVTAAKYCISDSFVDHDGYSISSMGFLPTVVDIMVI